MTSYKVLKITDFNFSEFQSLIGIVTPHLAAELLSLNMKHNRDISTPVVTRYSFVMSEGNWQLSDPIKFSKDGELIDGQHRLNALIKSGTSQLFICLTGYSKESAEVLDQGKKRLSLDIAKMRGLNITNSHISIMRMLNFLSIGYTSGTVVLPTPSEIVTACTIYSDMLEFALKDSNKSRSIKCAPVLASVALAYQHENHQRLEEFLYCWHTGTVLHGPEDNAAILLREAYNKKDFGWEGNSARMALALKSNTAIDNFLKRNKNISHIKSRSSLIWSASEFKTEVLKEKIKEFKNKDESVNA